MAKIRIEYEREKCIGAFACCSMDPERFEIGDDGKANLLGSEKKGEFFILEVDESLKQKVLDAAESCPVNVIHVFDEKGKKLI